MPRPTEPPSLDDVASAIATLEHAVSTRGGGKVMLRLDQAQAIRAVLEGHRPPACRLQEQGRPCACGLLDPSCENMVDPGAR